MITNGHIQVNEHNDEEGYWMGLNAPNERGRESK